jgi:hypothetical protein
VCCCCKWLLTALLATAAKMCLADVHVHNHTQRQKLQLTQICTMRRSCACLTKSLWGMDEAGSCHPANGAPFRACTYTKARDCAYAAASSEPTDPANHTIVQRALCHRHSQTRIYTGPQATSHAKERAPAPQDVRNQCAAATLHIREKDPELLQV